jgi:hypothetical protein
MATDDPRLIETGIEATRSRLAETLDRIQDKLTLTGIVDEVMGQAGVPRYGNGPDFVMGLLRRHPVPVMIAAAGLGFMIYQRNRARTLPAIHDADYVEVPATNDGHARLYDPDGGAASPGVPPLAGKRSFETQA